MNIGTIGTDRTKSLQVNIEEYKGRTGVDIREWYLGSDNKMHPTVKGLRIQLDMISQLITYLERAEQALTQDNKLPVNVAKQAATN